MRRGGSIVRRSVTSTVSLYRLLQKRCTLSGMLLRHLEPRPLALALNPNHVSQNPTLHHSTIHFNVRFQRFQIFNVRGGEYL